MKAVIYALALSAAAPLSAATLLVNGGFEQSPGMAGAYGGTFEDLPTAGRSWDVWTELPGWQTSSGAGIEVQTDRTLNIIDAHHGAYYVELDSHGANSNTTMYQDVELEAGTYELSFFYSPRRAEADTNGIAYSVLASSGSLLSETITGPGGGVPRRSWTEVTQRFTLTQSETIRLSFTATGTQDTYGGFLDDVSLAPVPLPAAGWMLLMGVAGMAALRARRTS